MLQFEPVAAPVYLNTAKNRDSKYKRFIAWDGEGITRTNNTAQDYVLFGSSDFDFPPITVESGSLSTVDCLDYMLEVSAAHTSGKNKLAIHVGYAFGYDVEMILRDIPPKTMQVLYKNGHCRWAILTGEGMRHYYIEYRKRKWFTVSEIGSNSQGRSIRIWDIFTFWQTSMVNAVREYMGETEDLKFIMEGKANRDSFDNMEYIEAYWRKEIIMYEQLADRLRENLYNAGLRINSWHGPGAVASFVLRQQTINTYMNPELYEEILEASQFAYAGGRFEAFKLGRNNGPVYSYDFRSAYPSAMTHLPCLAPNHGVWRHYTDNVPKPHSPVSFGVYRIQYRNGGPNHMPVGSYPEPLFGRDRFSRIHFPHWVTSWYWTPEAYTVWNLPATHVTEAWVWEPHCSCQPFAFVPEYYEQRRQWKAAGNHSQLALKLALNSLYGKMAQRVGGQNGRPKWHQLEYAGFVTSYTRARLWHAMRVAFASDSLISVETDGIFTSSPLPFGDGPLSHMPISHALGDIEATEYDDIVYVQSGFYWALRNDQWKLKARGFDRDKVKMDTLLKQWDGQTNMGRLTVENTLFPGMGIWLQNHGRRNVWEHTHKEMTIGNEGKRVHIPSACDSCMLNYSPSDTMHRLIISTPWLGFSKPHVIPWRTSPDEPINPYHFLTDDEWVSDTD